MGIVKRATLVRYLLVVSSLDDSKDESIELKDVQPSLSLQPAPM